MDSARASASKLRDLLAAITGIAAWFSLGTVAFTSGDADRVAALPSVFYLVAVVALAIVALRVTRVRLDQAWPLAISVLVILPFIPGPIPPVFMMWQGPIEAIVWSIALAGVIAARGIAPVGGPFRDPARAPVLAAITVGALSLVAFSQVRAVVPSGDEPHYLAATQSLIADGDLKVENNYADGSYLDYFQGRLQPHFLQRSASGEIYSIHAPGVSALVLPGFLAAGYPGAVFTLIVLTALSAALTWVAAYRVSDSAAAAWVGTAAVFATAPFLFHTFTIYPDGAGALLVMAAVWLMLRLDDLDVPSPVALAGIGGSLALLPWLHTRFALLSAVFGAAIVARLVRRRAPMTSLAAFLAVPVIAAAAWFGFFWVIWGTPSPLAPYGRDSESSFGFLARGLVGLLFDQQHGVLLTAPVLAVVPLGLRPLFTTRKPLALTFVAAIGIYGVAVATYAMWWGGTSAPGRFVVAILPLAAVLVASAWQAYPRCRVAVLVLLVISVSLVVPRIGEDGGRLVFNSRTAFDPTIEWLSRHVDLSLGLPSGHRDAPGIVFRDASPWLLAAIVVLGASFAAPATRGLGWQWMLVSSSAAVAMMAATTTVWMLHGARPVTTDRSILAALASHRSWHSAFVDLSRARSLSERDFVSRLAITANAEDGAALLRLRRVPAGEYDVTPVGDDAGAFAVVVSRNDPALENTTLPFRLRLPVSVSTLSLRAEASGPPGPVFRFTPAAAGLEADDAGGIAVRGARYGRARVFAFDERVYLEPTGFWTRAEGRATVVIDADAETARGGLPLSITAGAAATTIGISVGEWSQSYSMTPGEQREVVLPPLENAREWVVNIHSGPGFRPFEREPGSTDVRSLAAWFQIQ